MDPLVSAFVVFYRRMVIFVDIILFFINASLAFLRSFYRLFVNRPQRNIHGEIALVTGAGNGIGRHLSLQLSKLGVIVVAVDVNEEHNNETVEMIKRHGFPAFGYKCDISIREQVEELVRKVKNDVGDVTILINNAGIQIIRPLGQYTPTQIEKTVAVNLLGQLWMVRAFLPRMVQMDRGSIVSVAALGGYGGFPNMIPFCASKFAVRGYMESLYLELRQERPNHNLHLMTVAPFIVDTGRVKGALIRFPGLINIVKAEDAARTIIENMRRGETVLFLPGIYYYIQNFIRILPLRVQLLITDFVDTGVEIHYDNHDGTY